MKKLINSLLFALLASTAVGSFAAGSSVPLEKAPIDLRNAESLQRGAQTFANYCLSCHGAIGMRYNRLTDIGLTEAQIKDNLMFTTDKVGNPMKTAMDAKEAKAWFGATPPDLTLIARSRGSDWLYTYLLSFYRDDSRPTGWNNLVFDKVGMPNVLWKLQGEQVLETKKEGGHEVQVLKLVKPGTLTRVTANGTYDNSEFNHRVADLVNFMTYMSEPAQVKRKQIGYAVVLFLLFIMVPLTYLLKKEYWKDIH